jgi:anti-sigma28 factor (negative regulator of flagellin synthesis)
LRRFRVSTPSTSSAPRTKCIHMTVLAVRPQTRAAREALRTSRRFTSESRTTKVEQIKELLARDDYAVDPHKVAEAIVRRLLAERQC